MLKSLDVVVGNQYVGFVFLEDFRRAFLVVGALMSVKSFLSAIKAFIPALVKSCLSAKTTFISDNSLYLD